MHANAVVLQSLVDALRIVRHFFADRADLDLRGREPQRKCACIVLDQNAEESLDGTQERTVDHQGLVARAVVTDKLQAKARRQVEIELDGSELPGTPDGVDELDIDFRT